MHTYMMCVNRCVWISKYDSDYAALKLSPDIAKVTMNEWKGVLKIMK